MATYNKYETKKGQLWEYRIYYKDELTQEHKEMKKRGFKTKAEAKNAAEAVERDLQDGFKEENILLKDYMKYWLDSHKKDDIKKSTYENKMAQINKHILPYFQNIKLTDLKPMMYQNFIDDFAAKGYSRSTIENSHWILHATLELAVNEGKLKKNPAKTAKLKGKRKAKLDEWEFIENEDIELLLKAALADVKSGMAFEYYCFFYTLFESGMRKGEACGLTWNDIDFEENVIDVNKAMDTQKLQFTTTKTAASIRKIGMPQRVMNELKKLKKRQNENRMALGENYNREMNLVFCRADGNPFPKSTLFNVFRRMQTNSGVIAGNKPDGSEVYFSIHSTRHTHTAFCIQSNLHPSAIQERLGHGSSDVTMNIYAHVTKQTKVSSAKLYEEATADIFKNIEAKGHFN